MGTDAPQCSLDVGLWFVVSGLVCGGPATLDALSIKEISVFPLLDAPPQFMPVLYCSILVLSK